MIFRGKTNRLYSEMLMKPIIIPSNIKENIKDIIHTAITVIIMFSLGVYLATVKPAEKAIPKQWPYLSFEEVYGSTER